MYILHAERYTNKIENVSENVSNVSDTENQVVMKKKCKNVSNVSKMLVKLNIKELREIITNIVSEQNQPLLDELRKINANLLKMSITNKNENVSNVSYTENQVVMKGKNTNKNENVSTDPDTEYYNTFNPNLSVGKGPVPKKENKNKEKKVSPTEVSPVAETTHADHLPTSPEGEGFKIEKNSEEKARVADSPSEVTPEDACSDATFDSLITSFSVSVETEPTGTGVDAASLKAYPHNGCSGPLPRENSAAAPPAPQTAGMPRGAQTCPLSDFREADGTVTHFGSLNALGRNSEVSDLIRAAQDAIREAKNVRERVSVRSLTGCREVMAALDSMYRSVAAVVKSAQRRAEVRESYKGAGSVNEAWATGRSGWSEKQKNMVFRMAQEADNLMLTHPWKEKRDHYYALISELSTTCDKDKGDALIEQILNAADTLSAMAEGNKRRTEECSLMSTDALKKALSEHDRLVAMAEECADNAVRSDGESLYSAAVKGGTTDIMTLSHADMETLKDYMRQHAEPIPYTDAAVQTQVTVEPVTEYTARREKTKRNNSIIA